jgi:ubiquinone/menaquinone biosynthesis C-methylase UbiE
MPPTLSSQQQAQAECFDERYSAARRDVNFDHFDRPKFGPWNPYWFVYNTVRSLRQTRPQRLLHVGCGRGADAIRYAQLGFDVQGIDISPRAIEVASESAGRHELTGTVQFSVQPAEALEFPDGSFDLVVGVNVLHHLDAAGAIREASRVLRPGGTAIFKEPLATPGRDRLRSLLLVNWLVPRGTKSVPKGVKYGVSEGERNLDERDFRVFRESFGHVEIHRWRVLAVLSVLMAKRNWLERCDWMLFRAIPWVRRLGDQAVLIGRK